MAKKKRRKSSARQTGRAQGPTARDAALAAASRYRQEELAALAGGLALVPENLHHLAQLEWLAVVSLCGVPQGNRSFLQSSATSLLEGPVGAWVGRYDDPCDALATQTFTFHGGNHVFVDPYPESLFSLRLLATAILRFDRFSADFVNQATFLIQGFCAISDLIVSRAALGRNQCVPAPTRSLNIPSDVRLRELMAAVRIGGRELDELCQRAGLAALGAGGLGRLAERTDVARLPDDPCDVKQILDSPLLRLGDEVIVLAPHRLAEALVNRLLGLSAATDNASPLAEAFHELQVIEVDRNLEHLGLRRQSAVLRPWSESKDAIVSHSIFQCDLDKAIHVAVVSRALAPPGNEPTSAWNSPAVDEELRLAREAVPRWLVQQAPSISGWLSLVVIGGFGLESTIFVSRPKPDEPDILLFFGSDLEAIVGADLDDRSPLLFWKYSRSVRELETRAEIWATAPLDQFGAWRMRSRSFWTTYDTVWVEAGLGRTLHEEAIKRRDWHALPSWEPTRTIEVCNADGSGFPILLPRNMDANRLRIAVELPNLIVWILASEDLGNKGDDRLSWFDMGKMIAYWLWESSTCLVDEFTRLGNRCNGVVVEFQLLERSVTVPSEAGYQIERASSSRLFARIHPRFLERYDNTNATEREFVGNLVRAVLALPGLGSGDTELPEFIDKIAPLGVKRMIHIINTAEEPEFISAQCLPKPRYPDPADCIRIQRKVLATLSIPGDQASGEAATKWLNQAVGAEYADLRSLVGRFEVGDLRRRLLINNESLVHEDAEARLTLPSHLACYRSAATMTKRLLEEGPRRASALMATRFLLEHVVAEPTGGNRPASDADLDEMLALGREIIRMGVASDVAHFRLAKVSVTKDEGELMIDGGTYDEASHGSLLAFTREIIDHEKAREEVGRSRTSRRQDEAVAEFATLDSASQDEFGVSLSDIAKVLGEVLALALERGGPIVTVPEGWLRLHIQERTSLDESKLDSAFSQLILFPRTAFLQPPPGFERTDIWPWRFNRALSYVRRPLVRSAGADGSMELHFTPGHLYRSSKNLVNLITSGRLKARSKSLAAAMGAFTKAASDEFNDSVAAALAERGFQVRPQVAKIGKEKIADAKGNTLGDVDVLCLDVGKRRIVAVECKDFSMARMPNEVSADMNALFVSSERRRCAQDKHLMRLEWLKAHVDLIAAWLGCGATVGPWSVEGAFVFSVPLISPLLGKTRLPVWTVHEIRDGRGP